MIVLHQSVVAIQIQVDGCVPVVVMVELVLKALHDVHIQKQ